MKKALILSLVLLTILVVPAYAKNGQVNGSQNSQGEANSNSNSNSNENSKKHDVPPIEIDPTITITQGPTPTGEVTPTGSQEQDLVITPTTNPCDPNANWKNHGAYVSCVAHQHPGGKIVSEAAKSDIGKKHGEDLTPSPTGTASGTPTPSPITSALPTVDIFTPLSNLGTLLENFINFLKNLL